MSLSRRVKRQLIARVADEIQTHRERYPNLSRRERRKLARAMAKSMVLAKFKEMEAGNNE